MRLILLENGVDIVATQDEKCDMVIRVAIGELGFEGIKEWIEERLEQL